MGEDYLIPIQRRYEFIFTEDRRVKVESNQTLGYLIARVCLDKGYELGDLLRVRRVFDWVESHDKAGFQKDALIVTEMANRGERR